MVNDSVLATISSRIIRVYWNGNYRMHARAPLSPSRSAAMAIAGYLHTISSLEAGREVTDCLYSELGPLRRLQPLSESHHGYRCMQVFGVSLGT